jgi:hypothetical protein
MTTHNTSTEFTYLVTQSPKTRPRTSTPTLCCQHHIPFCYSQGTCTSSAGGTDACSSTHTRPSHRDESFVEFGAAMLSKTSLFLFLSRQKSPLDPPFTPLFR